MLCLVVIIPVAIYLAFSDKSEKISSKPQNSTSRDNEIIQEMKKQIVNHPSYAALDLSERKDCLLNLQAEVEGILSASGRQKQQYDAMPDGFAKNIEAQVIQQFEPMVKEAELRSIAIQELLDELKASDSHSEKNQSNNYGIQQVSIGSVSVAQENPSHWLDDDDD